MKTKLLFLFAILSFSFTDAQIVNIPNATLKTKLLSANATTVQIASSQTTDTNGNVTTFNSIDTNSDGEIQVTEALAIKYLSLSNVNLSNSTGLEAFINLESFRLTSNQLTTFDPNLFIHLKLLEVSNNQLTSLVINNPSNYVRLGIDNNLFTSFSLSGFVNLTYFSCANNDITTLDLTGLNSVTYFDCQGNLLTSLNAGGLGQLNNLQCGFNQLTSLNITGSTLLQFLSCQVNQLTSINLTGLNLRSLYCTQNQITALNLTGQTNLQTLNCNNNLITSLNFAGLTSLTTIECNTNQISTLTVSGLGLTALNTLNCGANQISSLNLTGLSSLRNLNCSSNSLTSIALTPVSQLRTLYCGSNQISTLSLTNLTQLTLLECANTLITSLNVSSLTLLQQLYIANNQISSINLTGLTVLRTLDFSGTLIPSMNIGIFPQLTFLYCNNTELTSIDGRSNPILNAIRANNCPNLTTIYAKNGYYNTNEFANCPNIQYLCVDENEVTINQNLITTYGYTNCSVSTYCSFVPGGTYYTIQGTNRFDANSNGCDATDNAIPRIKFSFTTGTTTGYLIADTTGNYRNDVPTGTHTFAPILENPTYFNISPPTATVIFPSTASPFIQNFCFAANGSHNDLEVAIFPVNTARPGFDAVYYIVYKNKGTQSQSGSVNLSFNDAVLDYVSSVPTFNTQTTNNLIWNFSNLLPFETRSIKVILNLNSSTETPALNSGDILTYTTSVNGATDETPNDNSSTINQTVTNALDPNDKTCVEGTTVSPSMVGQYMHYVVRFQNDGTANAQNVVIRDVIDTNKFDVSTLIPLSASASFTTRMISPNKVEFIFQNINLPFASGSNTGYVTFKIKTKSTLVIGDTFSNSANIYFDYNYPITTNNYITTVQTLGINESVADTKISVYPNPVKDFIHFDTQENVIKVEVYDIAGRILSSNSVNENKLNLSDLQTGNYILKVYTESGISNTKIIKE